MDAKNRSAAIRFLILLSSLLLATYFILDWTSFLFLPEKGRDMTASVVDGMKLSTSFMALVIVLLIADNRLDGRDRCLLISIFLIFHLADHFMVWKLTLYGIMVFLISQIVLMARHLRGLRGYLSRGPPGKDIVRISAAVFVLVILYVSLILMVIVPMLDSVFLKVAVAIYGVILSLSIVSAFLVPMIGHFPAMNSRLIVAGIILFTIGDILVGLRVASAGGTIGQISGNIIWVFYLPGVVLLALSGHRKLPWTKTQGPR